MAGKENSPILERVDKDKEGETSRINRSPVVFDEMVGLTQDGETDIENLVTPNTKSIKKKSKRAKHDTSVKEGEGASFNQ